LCLAAFFVPISTTAVVVCIVSYSIRMFAITGFFHRYFAHKAFQTSRGMQALFAALGTAATQRGPLWWAAHQRHHHRHSDTEEDHHSPLHGFWRSHCGWFLGEQNFDYDEKLIQDFSRYPELRWMDRFDSVVVLTYAALLFALGEALNHFFPSLGTSGIQLFIWGYVISTVALIHATLSINSLGHRFGSRRYETDDQSRNNWLLALFTFGEGWHNNHHAYPRMAKHGHRWWEFDITWQAIRLLRATGLAWDVVDYRNAAEKKEKEVAKAA